MLFQISFFIFLASVQTALAATAEQWRGRSIYQCVATTVATKLRLCFLKLEAIVELLQTALRCPPVRPRMPVTQVNGHGVAEIGIRKSTKPQLFSSLPNAAITYRIRQNLDYVQNAGFTAGEHSYTIFLPYVYRSTVWISPVNQNYEGPRSAYGDPYHGYWMADVSKLNSRFGTADDLKALSAELHHRNMYDYCYSAVEIEVNENAGI